MKSVITKRLIAGALLLAFVACKKDDPVILPGKYDNGILVLNEGLYQQNNASVSFYSFNDNQVTQQVFYSENDRGLGDVANDWEYYEIGDSSYIIMAIDLSSQLEIVNAKSMKSIAQIPVFDGTIAREPRRIMVDGTKAYSCNYDGTVTVVDLVSNSITNTIAVGANPDGMAIVGNMLYTANSGGLNWPVYDSTITVVNTSTEAVVTTFESRVNCTMMLSDTEGDIYVVSNGDYGSVLPAMLRVDTQTNQVTEEFDVAITSWFLEDDWIYYYDSNLQGVYRFNTLSETFENVQLIDCSSYQNMYGIYLAGALVITVDANGFVNSSTVRCYNSSGVFQYEFTAGFNATDLKL